MINKPTLIQSKGLRFLILDAPSNLNAPAYAVELENAGAHTLVRTCESIYDDNIFKSRGITIHELYFQDGVRPPKHIASQWLKLVRQVFATSNDACIGVHCLAGLGRAPVLVAIALIEAGLDPLDCIKLIRDSRPGAFNYTQINYLRSYKKANAHMCCQLVQCNNTLLINLFKKLASSPESIYLFGSICILSTKGS